MNSTVDYGSFIEWLADKLESVQVKFNIPKSARNSNLIDKKVMGVDEVLRLYSWKASWTDKSNRQIQSHDWNSTKASISSLRQDIRIACASPETTDKEVLEACKHIFEWGGERDPNKGASKFLKQLAAENRLKKYLLASKSALLLTSVHGPVQGEIKQMNSMLTKVHAFLADDGLPIYDSRVAATAACFVEIYRRETTTNPTIPDELLFPAVGGQGDRRTVSWLFPDCPNARILRYGNKNIAFDWTRAKWHLGRVICDVLVTNPKLFAHEMDIPSRSHALEASFFMIGYDVRCLAKH